uniref:Zn(2)-C6 fungal-type domain-containing protein n=1 Tax=Spongospora subterranea TaxID=70186 RepID=A0A0H5RS71_9EUKA|eukprot:CRZ11584.1 hypothetical protein [Spongospora subterranea]
MIFPKGEERSSRKTTQVACSCCVRAKARCGTERPCQRCVRLNRAETCIDRVQQARDNVSSHEQPVSPAATSSSSSSSGCPDDCSAFAILEYECAETLVEMSQQ